MNRRDAFDRLTALAAAMCDAPIALVTVLDGERQWFRSQRGFDEPETLREEAFCSHAVAMGRGALMVVPDALLDTRFQDNRLVRENGVRFYAGAVITTADGRQDGAVCVIDDQPRPSLSDHQAEALRMLAIMAGHEIDQIAAERARYEQLQTLKLAEAMAGVGHWRWDVDTDRVTWSDEVFHIHGLDPATFDPSLDSAVGAYHPEDQIRLQALIDHALATGEGYECEFRVIRTDGVERITRAKAVCEKDGTGRVKALFGVFQDVTEQVRAHSEMAASEARYRLLADNATDIIALYGLDGVFRYVSPAIEGPMGYRSGEMIGRAFSDFVHPEDVDHVRRAFNAYVRAGPDATPPRVPYRAIRKDGSCVWLEAHPRIMCDEAGHAVGFQDVVRDISETKALEDQLTLARDTAEAGARAKSEFLANMSHELRTPLTSVIGFSGLLQASENLPEAERRYADRIATASEALLSVINDILDYSKLEAGAVELDPQPFDPRELAQGAASIVEDQCAKKGLKLVLELADDLPTGLMGDADRLRQVLLNFLSNAVKFTARGSVTLRLGGTESPQGWRLRAEVADSGIGIAADKMEALFERFTQADTSTTRTYGGTGLGLSISRRLIEMMGGEVGADSRPGEGSTFWFEATLPEADANPGRVPELGQETLPRGGRVLMVDDTAANRELVGVILTGLGLTVETACDGAEAVEAVRNGAYDLVLMDVHMPVMDGLTATRAIRALGGTVGRTPIVALTANVQAENVQTCLDAGMDDHVAKPIQVAELAAAIGRHLNPEGVPAEGLRKGA